MLEKIFDAILSGFMLALVEFLFVSIIANSKLAEKPWFNGKRGVMPFIKDGVVVAVLYFVISWFW